MNKNKKKFSTKSIIPIVFFMVIGFLCGITMAEFAFTSEKPFLNFLILIAVMYTVLFLQIIVHESGHLIFGLMTGYKFVSFRVGSLMIVKSDGKLRFKRFSLAGTGGQCLLSPPEMKDGTIPYILYNLGGSILNLITAVICAVLGTVFFDIELIRISLYISAIVGIIYALMNGLPLHLGAIDNDGYNTLSMSKDQKALRSLWIQMKINELQTEGIRLKDMPKEWFELPLKEDLSNSMTSVLGILVCNRLMDKHEFDEAEKLMNEYVNGENSAVGLYKSLLKCDLAYCEMIKDLPDIEKVEKILDKEQKAFMKSMKDFPSVVRTEYTYELLIKKDIESAKKIRERFVKISKTYPTQADLNSESELFEIADTKAIMPLCE